MYYADGKIALMGDLLATWERGPKGVIVGDIEAGTYTHGQSASNWAYLKKGLLVLFEGDTQPVLLDDLDEDTFLIRRKED